MEAVVDANAFRRIQVKIRRMWNNIDDVVEQIVEDDSQFFLVQIQENIRTVGLVETGEYLRSWFVERRGDLEFAVVSRHPAAHRLEKGFVGTDALGRHYSQAPRPHVLPAEQATMTKFRDDLRKGVGGLWRR